VPHRDTGERHARSAFAAGIGFRLAVAFGAAAVLWLAVFWALAR
jgi:hypothetical protein